MLPAGVAQGTARHGCSASCGSLGRPAGRDGGAHRAAGRGVHRGAARRHRDAVVALRLQGAAVRLLRLRRRGVRRARHDRRPGRPGRAGATDSPLGGAVVELVAEQQHGAVAWGITAEPLHHGKAGQADAGGRPCSPPAARSARCSPAAAGPLRSSPARRSWRVRRARGSACSRPGRLRPATRSTPSSRSASGSRRGDPVRYVEKQLSRPAPSERRRSWSHGAHRDRQPHDPVTRQRPDQRPVAARRRRPPPAVLDRRRLRLERLLGQRSPRRRPSS